MAKRGILPAHKVLVADDDLTLRETLEHNLTRQGYEVRTAADGQTALDLARRERPDLVVLDLMLPGLDGVEVCRVLRQESSVPIIILTARSDEEDKVVGLEVGADDYITKPFSMRELLARVKAALRRERLVREELASRGVLPGEDRELTFGDLSINLARGEILRGGAAVHLKPREYDLLVFLARNKGIVLSRDLILQRVWEWDYVGASRTVDVHVRWLRKKIEVDPSNPRRIVTVRGMGYRFDG